MKILFTQWFKATPEVLTYNLYCLYRNLSNESIDKLVLFVENCEFNNVFNEKLIVVPIQTRLSYKMWMDYADKEYPKDLTKDGNIIPSSLAYNPNNTEQIDPSNCQDAWIYKKINSNFNKDWAMGILHCENHFRIEVHKSGVEVFNLFDCVKLIHVDWRNSKNYSKQPYEFPVAPGPVTLYKARHKVIGEN